MARIEPIEVLRDDESGATRVTLKYKNILWIVKIFDPEFPENVSIKLFDQVDLYEKTKSFWNTNRIILDEERDLEIKKSIKVLVRYLNKIRVK